MSYPVRYVGPELTAAQLGAIEHEPTRLVRRDPVNGIYTIVSGVKSAQEKREQHTREAPLCADAAVYWERVGNKKNAHEFRDVLISIARSNSVDLYP